jgi:hypothetical protein
MKWRFEGDGIISAVLSSREKWFFARRQNIQRSAVDSIATISNGSRHVAD